MRFNTLVLVVAAVAFAALGLQNMSGNVHSTGLSHAVQATRGLASGAVGGNSLGGGRGILGSVEFDPTLGNADDVRAATFDKLAAANPEAFLREAMAAQSEAARAAMNDEAKPATVATPTWLGLGSGSGLGLGVGLGF